MRGTWYFYAKRLLIALAIILVFFSVSRLVFFVSNYTFFSHADFTRLLVAFIHGIRFDISIILALNSPLIALWLLPSPLRQQAVYQKALLWLYMLVNGMMLFTNFLDAEYFKFTKKRSTSDLIDFIFLSDDVGTLIPTFIIDYWHLILLWVFTLVAIYLLYKKYVFVYTNTHIVSKSTGNFIAQVSLIPLAVAVVILGIRGGWQGRPLNVVSATEFNSPPNNILVLNTPFTLFQTLGKNDLSELSYLPQESETEFFSSLKQPKPNETFKATNVVVIIVESLSKEMMASINKKGIGYTPFLDSLVGVSYVCDNAYSHGFKSIEGVPAILASIPTYMNNPFITSSYILNNFNSIASLLKGKDYSTAFLHGGANGTMGFNTFYKAAGFDKYYGKDEYGNEADYDGNWGIWDEEFLQYSAAVIDTMKKPFMASIFTLTSHHPYSIPEKYKAKFEPEEKPFFRALRYTDYSLQQFFKTASKSNWFNNTLFVITADHPWHSQSGFYQTSLGVLSIPIIYYAPGKNLTGTMPKPTHQADIMPSIMDYLNYDLPYVAFGQSVFDTLNNNFACSFVGENYQFTQGMYTLQFDGEQSFGLYNYYTDSLLQHNLVDTEIEIKDSLEIQLKAYIQQYNHRLIANKMLN